MNDPQLQAAGQSALFWLLADLFLTCPDAAQVERLRGDLVGVDGDGVLAVALKGLAAALPGDGNGVHASAIEFTRLFGAVRRDYGPPPPYEAMHRTGAGEELSSAVEAFYANAGFAISEPATPPDHIGLELRFMALLCHDEAESLRSGDVDGARRARAMQASFLETHLLTWAPGYLEMIAAEARVPFYAELARTASTAIVQAAGAAAARSEQ
jgi:putative dimethyl sulfoxide reductase chaperone